MFCYTCLSISGEKRISPGPYIHVGEHWVVDHAYPTIHLGWLVILPKRHIEAMHELSLPEMQELAEIQYRLLQVMHQDPTIQKEYMMQFAEGEGFQHVHIHLVPKPDDLPDEHKGPRVFARLSIAMYKPELALAAEAITAYCEDFTRKYQILQ